MAYVIVALMADDVIADDVIANPVLELVIEDDFMVVAAMKLAPVPVDVSVDVFTAGCIMPPCVVIFNVVCFLFSQAFLLYLVYYIKYNMCLMQYIPVAFCFFVAFSLASI